MLANRGGASMRAAAAMLDSCRIQMARVRILPLDIEIEAPEDAGLMASAQAAGLYWPTTCGGEGRCTTCACEVEAGAGSLSAMGRSERRTLVEERGERAVESSVRLACQARVTGPGPIIVRKAGVRAV
jgi:2Fe-2S ferredoxin